MKRIITAVVAASMAALTSAHAAYELDQSQTSVAGPETTTLAIGGDVEQVLAQTFRVGHSGPLAAISAPVGCQSGELIIDIVELSGDLPSGIRRGGTTRPAAELPVTPDAFQFIQLDASIPVSVGDRLGIVFRNETGECGIKRSPPGDHYAEGDGFFESAPEFAGWQKIDFDGLLPDEGGDLPFKTYIKVPDTPRDNRCVAVGVTDPNTGEWLVLPIGADTPACRCFEDSVARELRCGVLHPDFIMVRRVPLPLIAGKKFTEQWDFTPLTDLDGPVRMTLKGGGLYKPVYRDFGYKAEQGQTETFKVIGVAPKNLDKAPGLAAFEYGMEDATNEYLKKFGLDTSFDTENYK